MDSEKLKTWLDFSKFILGTFILGLSGIIINHEIQKREIEIKEIQQLGQFVPTVIDDSVYIRRRFAQYFSVVLSSDSLRQRWKNYATEINAEYEAVELAKKEAIEKETEIQKLIDKSEGDSQVAALQIQLDSVHQNVSRLTSELTRSQKEECRDIKSIKSLGWVSGHKTKFCLARGYDGVHNPYGSYSGGGFCYKGPSKTCVTQINAQK